MSMYFYPWSYEPTDEHIPRYGTVIMCMASRYFEANTFGYRSCPSFFFLFFSSQVRSSYRASLEETVDCLVRLIEIVCGELDQGPSKHIVQCQMVFMSNIYELRKSGERAR